MPLTAYFKQMVGQIYPTELHLKKANFFFDSEAPFLDLHLSITRNGIVSSKNYIKQDNFNFAIVNFLFLDGDVPRSPYLWCIYFASYSFCESVLKC